MLPYELEERVAQCRHNVPRVDLGIPTKGLDGLSAHLEVLVVASNKQRAYEIALGEMQIESRPQVAKSVDTQAIFWIFHSDSHDLVQYIVHQFSRLWTGITSNRTLGVYVQTCKRRFPTRIGAFAP